MVLIKKNVIFLFQILKLYFQRNLEKIFFRPSTTCNNNYSRNCYPITCSFPLSVPSMTPFCCDQLSCTWAPHLFDPSVTRLSAAPATKRWDIPKSVQGEKMLWEEVVLWKVIKTPIPEYYLLQRITYHEGKEIEGSIYSLLLFVKKKQNKSKRAFSGKH